MGLLDFLFDQDKKEERKYAKLEKTLTNMYVQPSERSYLIEQLRDLRTAEACRVLLKRFGDSRKVRVIIPSKDFLEEGEDEEEGEAKSSSFSEADIVA